MDKYRNSASLNAIANHLASAAWVKAISEGKSPIVIRTGQACA